MPTIAQLPAAGPVTAADDIPISQNGTTCMTSVGALLASTQPAITVGSPSLIGRTSLGSGGPEQVAPGVGLTLAAGTLTANGADHAAFPAMSSLSPSTELVVSQQGHPMLMPASLLRSLFSAGQNISISSNGTISAAGESGTSGNAPINGLPIVTSLAAQDLVAASHAGANCAISYANLINGITIGNASAAGPAEDTDTFWVAQGDSAMVSQTLGAVWTWITGKLPAFRIPVLEITASTNLDPALHNNHLLICSQPVTVTPLPANMDSGFHCRVLNATTGNVTLGNGFVTSSGSMILPPWQVADIVGASYSGGTIVFASMPRIEETLNTSVGQVTGMTASASTTSITLNWQAPSGGAEPTSYIVQFKVSGTATWTAFPPVTGATTFQATGLQESTSYDFTVQAVNGTSVGLASSSLTVSTNAEAPPPAAPTVTDLVASASSGSSVQLGWTAGGGTATSYTIQYGVAGSSAATTLSNVTGTSATVEALQAATTYDFTVTGIGSTGPGPASNVVTVTMPAATPAVASISWNYLSSASYTSGSGSIGVNAHVSPSSAGVQFGLSTSNTSAPSTWIAGANVNSDLWGAYLPVPAATGTWYVWAEGIDGSALTVNPTPITVG